MWRQGQKNWCQDIYRKNQRGVKGNKKGWFYINKPLVCLDWALCLNTEPCAWSLFPVLSYVWIYCDLQAEAEAEADRHNFYQIQLFPVMWASIKLSGLKGKNTEQNKMSAENTDREITCQPGSCEPGNGSWEPETSLKNAAGTLKYSWVPRNHIYPETPLHINGMAIHHLKNWKQSGETKITKRKENFIHPWTFTSEK